MGEPLNSGKLYSRIGEVARLTGLKPSVLRFWETEFPEISPQKSSTGQRLYSQQNIAAIIDVKELLYKEKLTIAGARNRLRSKSHPRSETWGDDATRQHIIEELLEIKKLLMM